MSANDLPELKSGVNGADQERDEQCVENEDWCPGPLAHVDGNAVEKRCFACFLARKPARMERATERARMHAAQALTRVDDDPEMAREHMRETLSLLDAVAELIA